MNKENKTTLNNLIYALLFLVFGIILLTSTEDLITIASKVIGTILIIIGIVKSIVYIYMKGKLGDYNFSELVIGLLIICFGVLLIMSSNALSFAIRIIVGLLALLTGINKIVLAISLREIDKTGFRVCLVTSLITIIVGLLLISGVFDQIIGILIIIYSVTEIINYIYFKSKTKEEFVNNKKDTKRKKSTKRIKGKKVVDAIIEEENDKK